MIRHYYKQETTHSPLINAVKTTVGYTTANALALIEQGSVWINKKRIKTPDVVLHKEDGLTIYEPLKPIVTYKLNKDNIIYEDDHLVIAYKERGINTCATPITDRDNIYDALKNYYHALDPDNKLYLVNRLDNPTAGLLIFTRTKKAAKKMHKLFLKRKIKKLYLAATPHFQNSKSRYRIEDRLDWRERTNRKAVTIIIHKERTADRDYFYVYPKTGRTHQIRKHFAKYLVPLQGDSEYGGYPENVPLQLSCIMYRFIHPIYKTLLTVKYIHSSEQI